jgi:hypothetical protein
MWVDCHKFINFADFRIYFSQFYDVARILYGGGLFLSHLDPIFVGKLYYVTTHIRKIICATFYAVLCMGQQMQKINDCLARIEG